MSASTADEISADGTRPLPPIEELAVMDRMDLVSMQAEAGKRCLDLKLDLENATEDLKRASRKIEAIRRARKWHGHLHQLAQHALSLGRDAEEAERLESSIERDESEARRFLKAARRILSPEVCRAVWDETSRDGLDPLPGWRAGAARDFRDEESKG